MEIYERIKLRRKELNLTADDVAAALGVSRATVYRYESADIEKLPTQIIVPLADVLKCSPAWLMGWANADAPAPVNASDLVLSPLEESIIMRFRLLPDGERNMILRSLGLEEEKKKDASITSAV